MAFTLFLPWLLNGRSINKKLYEKKFLAKYLGFDSQNMSVRTEVIAGITIFLTMSYILAVNPAILGATGMDKT